MRIAVINEALGKLDPKDLDELIAALDTACKRLPEQLIQEMGLRTLWNITKIVKLDKKQERACSDSGK